VANYKPSGKGSHDLVARALGTMKDTALGQPGHCTPWNKGNADMQAHGQGGAAGGGTLLDQGIPLLRRLPFFSGQGAGSAEAGESPAGPRGRGRASQARCSGDGSLTAGTRRTTTT
jgi:hypothetical protein